MTQEISLGCNMTYDEKGEFYHPTTIYSFIKNPKFEVDDKFYLAIFNSNLMWFFLKNTGTELRGGYFRFKTNYLKPFPLPEIPENSNDFIAKADEMLQLNKELQEVSAKFKRTLQRRLFSTPMGSNKATPMGLNKTIPMCLNKTIPMGLNPLESNQQGGSNKTTPMGLNKTTPMGLNPLGGKNPLGGEGLKLSKKLETWYILSFTEFVKELKKKKIKLSLSQEADWEDYFLAEQQKAVAIQTQITQTDKQIDAMVYELYGLTEGEIKIVES